MKNTIISRILTVLAMFSIVLAVFLAVPQGAMAWGGNDYGNYGGGYSYNNYNYNYTYNYNYNNYSYNNNYQYPPAPNYRTVPSVQVTYSNGYYQNYFVPTVRYFPATNPLPVYTTYYPTQPPAYTYPGYNNFPGNYYGGYHY